MLPTITTYLVKDYVEKWGAKVVEDTIQNKLKIISVYVVAPAFVEVVGIKDYSKECVILNIILHLAS